MLQGMIERRNWKMLWNGSDFGKKKTKIFLISKQPSIVQMWSIKTTIGCGLFSVFGEHDDKWRKTYTWN